jgi:hypothetical protein
MFPNTKNCFYMLVVGRLYPCAHLYIHSRNYAAGFGAISVGPHYTMFGKFHLGLCNSTTILILGQEHMKFNSFITTDSLQYYVHSFRNKTLLYTM